MLFVWQSLTRTGLVDSTRRRRIRTVTSPVTSNPYTNLTPVLLQSKWNEVKTLVAQRDQTLQDELRKQEKQWTRPAVEELRPAVEELTPAGA